MSSRTITLCDKCKKEIFYPQTNRVEINRLSMIGKLYYHGDLCEECCKNVVTFSGIKEGD